MLEVFGMTWSLVPSTTPVPGKRSASVIGADGAAWADLFLWDPAGGILQFDEQRLDTLLYETRRAKSPWLNAVLWLTDALMWMMRSVRALFSGSYGGTFGHGTMGGAISSLSAVMLLVVTLLTALVTLPVGFAGWIIRTFVSAQVRAERERLLPLVSAYFERREAAGVQATEKTLTAG